MHLLGGEQEAAPDEAGAAQGPAAATPAAVPPSGPTFGERLETLEAEVRELRIQLDTLRRELGEG